MKRETKKERYSVKCLMFVKKCLRLISILFMHVRKIHCFQF